ncbi:hypothetical protein [Prolixibacter denitrificans]|uniref:Lipocalin-like protein n=1 Tax=Prolixibacter denitrificans TaxID=1541063 RepID=A0A2P8C742_9BACT|nr:hypothetical protein [Prolixibacter denitrificans]PSK80747.1 hypothetical protein CLV93_11341 [Prolixibacter denitrificans]GET22454.1 hypothetical protein JCM18694_27000 [Prolixibacter denitrificans]
MPARMMNRFNFLLGEWNLTYTIPESSLSSAGTDTGVGKFTKEMNSRYVVFDYATASGGEAKGIFAWDEKTEIYRYWWFENSGNFLDASCEFLDDDTLAMNWHNTLLVQTFTRVSEDKVILKMEYPVVGGGYELIMEVVFTR